MGSQSLFPCQRQGSLTFPTPSSGLASLAATDGELSSLAHCTQGPFQSGSALASSS